MIRIDIRKISVWLAGLFIILKLYDAYWNQSGKVGGFWNYIQIYFIVLSIVVLLINTRVILNSRAIRILFSYSILAFLLSSIMLPDFSTNTLFNWVMLLFAPGVLIVFYSIGVRCSLNSHKILLIVYYIAAAIAIIAYFQYFTGMKAIKGDGAKVYYILGLLPLTLIYSSKRKYIPIVIAILASILSAKRGAMVAVALMLIAWIVVSNSKKGKSLKSTLKILFAIIATVLFVVVVFNYINVNINTNLFHRFEKLSYDGGSGRTDRWNLVINEFKNSSFLLMLIGHGKDSIIAVVGGNAHNDFLEVLFNHGIICLIMYIAFYVFLISQYFEMRRRKYIHSDAFIMSIICSLCIAMYSFYIIDPNYVICGMMSYGLLLADFEKTKQENSNGSFEFPECCNQNVS